MAIKSQRMQWLGALFGLRGVAAGLGVALAFTVSAEAQRRDFFDSLFGSFPSPR